MCYNKTEPTVIFHHFLLYDNLLFEFLLTVSVLSCIKKYP